MSQLLSPAVPPSTMSESDIDVSSEFTSEGCDSTADFEELPSRELLEKLVTALEFYFSDETLSKDLFLLKHIKRQPEGYVSLKLLAGYKKIKKLSRSWRVVGLAASQSNVLELNEHATRVKRKKPLPVELMADLPSSRTLLAIGIPNSLCNIEALASKFGVHGSIAALQLLKPGKSNLQQLVHPSILASKPEMSETPCALIEFENVWGASKALHDNSIEAPMSLHVIKENRRDRTIHEQRSCRPCHHQLYRLLVDGSSGKRCSESSGSDADDVVKLGIQQKNSWRSRQSHSCLGPPRVCASVPSSPAVKRCPLGYYSGSVIKSPRDSDVSSGSWREHHCTTPR